MDFGSISFFLPPPFRLQAFQGSLILSRRLMGFTITQLLQISAIWEQRHEWFDELITICHLLLALFGFPGNLRNYVRHQITHVMSWRGKIRMNSLGLWLQSMTKMDDDIPGAAGLVFVVRWWFRSLGSYDDVPWGGGSINVTVVDGGDGHLCMYAGIYVVYRRYAYILSYPWIQILYVPIYVRLTSHVQFEHWIQQNRTNYSQLRL